MNNKYIEKIATEEKKAGVLGTATGVIKNFASKPMTKSLAGAAVNTAKGVAGTLPGKIGMGLAGGALAAKALSSNNQQVKQAGLGQGLKNLKNSVTGQTGRDIKTQFMHSGVGDTQVHLDKYRKALSNTKRDRIAVGVGSVAALGAGAVASSNKK